MLLERLDTIIAFVAILLGVSLLIMIVTQAISALLNLRGGSLSTGVQILFTTSGMEQRKARNLTTKVLHHELISDTSGVSKQHRTATTIRQNELENILDVIEDQEATAIRQQNKGKIQKLEHEIASCEKELEACEKDPEKSEEDRKRLRDKLRDKLRILKKDLGKLKDWVEKEIAENRKKLEALKAHVHVWFDAVMDRTSQRFVRRARLVTAILSLVTALALHLDAFTLYDRLANDSALRESVVASTKQLVDHADSILDSDSKVVPTAYQSALEELKALSPAVIERTIGKEAVEPITNLPMPATPIASRRDAEIWLFDKLGDISDATKGKALAEYHKKVEAKLSRSLERLRDSALSIKDDLDSTEFRLIPSPYPSPLDYFRDGMHLLGTLAMAALLSLGAPFWFDALKKLMSVRPVLAGKVEQERQGKKPQKSMQASGSSDPIAEAISEAGGDSSASEESDEGGDGDDSESGTS